MITGVANSANLSSHQFGIPILRDGTRHDDYTREDLVIGLEFMSVDCEMLRRKFGMFGLVRDSCACAAPGALCVRYSMTVHALS